MKSKIHESNSFKIRARSKTQFLKITGILAATGIALMSFTKLADAPEWTIDNAHSSISFMATHLNTPLLGTFGEIDAKMNFDEKNLAGSSITFTAQTKSINTMQEQRDGHLKSADFFDAAKYPTITFKSESFKKKSETEYVVCGSLTVKDVTKKIELPFTITAMKDHPFKKDKMLMGVKLSTLIKRTDYNIGVGDWAKDAVIGNDVAVQFFAEFTRAK